ncbi:TPR-like protein [Mycena sp. CBHHK59/15]|nr:TPR-like protein [Mycena sp. CBHHK59/15]
MIDTLNQAVCAYADAVRDSLGDVCSLYNLGSALMHRVEKVGAVDDIIKCVWVMQYALHRTPDGHPDKPSLLDILGASLFHRFQRLGDLDDLNKSILIGEEAVRLTPDGHPDRHLRLSNLGGYLSARFQRLGDLDDVKKSILMGEEAVCLTPDGHPDRQSTLNNLGTSLFRRFERLGDLEDLNKSVSMREEAVHLTPDGHLDRPPGLNSLGNSLLTRFEQLGDLDDLNNAISIGEEAVHLTPDDHPAKSLLLSNLGNSLSRRFERLGDLDDVNKSILMGEEAVCLTPDGHPDKPLRLSNLGGYLLARFEQLNDLEDLNKSVSMREEAVCLTPDGHPDRPSTLNNLGTSLFRRSEQLGDLDDVNKSISIGEEAVRLTPDGHPYKPSMLNNLGTSLFVLFQQLGHLDDLNKSVSMTEEAVHLTPDGHPDKLPKLINLGNSLLTRFKQLGDLGDLNRSTLTGKEAVRLTPNSHPDRPLWLSNLGTSLFVRFEQLSDLDDLNNSISIIEEAVCLIPDGHPDRPLCLNSLGCSLLARFLRLGDLGDLNNSISIGEEAVRLTPDGHPDRPLWLNNLGNSFFRRFEQLGDLDNLNKSVSLREEAVRLTPDDHPVKPLMLNNLSSCLHTRFEHLDDQAALQRALLLSTLAACSTTGPADIRFNAASKWAKLAQEAEHPSLLHAYQVAVGLLPELAWLGLSISDRHYSLLKAGKVVRDAAAAAIASGQAENAVEWLEQGRSVIWGQLLNLRTPVDMLSNSHPELADRLLSLSVQLEGSGTRASHSVPITSGAQESLQSVADRAHQNAYHREELLKEIRGLEGFSRFLLPRTISELSQAAQKGPVVLLNISYNRCDALILMPGLDGEVMHIPLTEFTPGDAESLANSLGDLVGRGERLHGQREGHLHPEDALEQNLSKLWFGVVKPVLNGLAMTTPSKSNLPRIWWCPTGPLAFLPIHAAGLYGKDDSFGSKLSDFMISSYAPSLTALIESFRAPSKSQKGLQLLAVAQPSALGQYYIPGTQEEITRIQQLAGRKPSILRLDEDMATVERVQKGMRESRWVHFACHGVQDMSHPTESALLLAGSSRLTLSSIIQLALPHAELAFLSACQTASGDKSLEEESVHLAAGMLLAGYRGVIATMWTIMDNDAPQVASDVYEHLVKTSPPDSTQAAEALHLTVQKLREGSSTKKSFFHWVPFIHVGV